MIKKLFVVYKTDIIHNKVPLDTFMSYNEALDFVKYYLERAQSDPQLDSKVCLGIDEQFKWVEDFKPIEEKGKK